jgi:hypothetical protein
LSRTSSNNIKQIKHEQNHEENELQLNKNWEGMLLWKKSRIIN